MSEADKPKSKETKEKEQKIADDAANYIFEEILGGSDKKEEEKDTEKKETIVDSVPTDVSEAAVAGK